VLGGRLKKLPDGETGRRKNWINFQYGVLATHPSMTFDGPAIDIERLTAESDGEGADYAFTRLKIRDGASPADLAFHDLGYAANALRSYTRFAELKAAGEIAADVRFQVSLPTPLAPVAMFVTPPQIFAVYPAYAKALLGEVAEIAAAIPHDQLAIQWDVAIEIGLWEGLFPPPPGDWRALLLGQLGQLAAAVPADVAVGYHLCYGDRGHKHFVEPKDTANLVEIANGILSRAARPVSWIHMPVPRDRDDDAYYAPLAGLALPEGTTLFLGLVHLTDGAEGTRRRIAAASKVVSAFGIGTECGFGRRHPSTIPALLHVHAETE
jgi:hypothetical protein